MNIDMWLTTDPLARVEIEVKASRPLGPGYVCIARGCTAPALMQYEVGKMRNSYGSIVCVCADHDSDIFDIYEEDLARND